MISQRWGNICRNRWRDRDLECVFVIGFKYSFLSCSYHWMFCICREIGLFFERCFYVKFCWPRAFGGASDWVESLIPRVIIRVLDRDELFLSGMIITSASDLDESSIAGESWFSTNCGSSVIDRTRIKREVESLLSMEIGDFDFDKWRHNLGFWSKSSSWNKLISL